jgi:hypothetical protein
MVSVRRWRLVVKWGGAGRCSMTRMSITGDEALVEETRKALKARTKAEAIRQALEEALRRRRLERVLDHAGRVELDLNQGRLRRLRKEG